MAEPNNKRPNDQAARARKRRAAARNRKRKASGRPWQWIVVAVVIVAAGIVGIVIQASRSKTENTKVVTPKAAVGPGGSIVVGDKNAKVLVEEYGDFQCPVCKELYVAMNPTIQDLVAKGTIRFAFHPVDVIDSHSAGSTESLRAASAAFCANDAGKFDPYYNLLYENQASTENSGFFTDDQLIKFGTQAGITGSAFNTFESCVKQHTYEGYVLKYQAAAEKPPRSISGTPSVFIDDRNIPLTDLVTGSSFDPKKLEALVQSA